jgi:hypothetical protein
MRGDSHSNLAAEAPSRGKSESRGRYRGLAPKLFLALAPLTGTLVLKLFVKSGAPAVWLRLCWTIYFRAGI